MTDLSLPPGVLQSGFGTGTAAGHRLGRYLLQKKLGEGPMAEVYLARDDERNLQVALKILTRATESDLDRFHREADLVKRLNHPHIIQIHDISAIEGRHCIAMAYMAGGSLASARLPGLRDALAAIRDVCSAVDCAHAAGIIHRDIKPSNILLDDARRAYLADFGLAKESANGTDTTLSATGMIIGTPGFLSPEQAKGNVHQLTGATDLYALGATLYFLVTGHSPIEAPTMLDAITRAAEGDFPDPTVINPGIPREVEALILKAMALDARRRYATGAEMAEDIDRYLRGDSVKATYEVSANRVASQQEDGWRVRRKVLLLAGDNRLAEQLQMDRLGLYEVLVESTLAGALKILKNSPVDVAAGCDDVPLDDVRRLLSRVREERPDTVRVLFLSREIAAASLIEFVNSVKIDVIARSDDADDPLGAVLDQLLRTREAAKGSRSTVEQLREARRQLRAVQESLFVQNRDLEEKNRYLESQNGELSKIRSALISLAGELQKKNGDLQDAYGRIEELSTSDALTKVFNRRGFYDAARHDLQVAARMKHRISLLMIDIDRFKQINDSWGHPAGDTVLEGTAAVIKGCLRKIDRVARFGGEEFVALLPQAPLAAAAEVADRILKAVAAAAYRLPDGREIRVTVSIGAAEAIDPAAANELDGLVRRADEAMYRAKHAGRNRVMAADQAP